MTIEQLLDTATRILFFTGKGGVGKTSVSCATGVALAARGTRVLLVSTDPASNLDEVLAERLTGDPKPVRGAEGLFALNIDPEAAAAAYRERVIGPYRDLLPAAVIASMEEQLSGACTVEIAAFDQFTKLLGDPDGTAEFDHIIFDTAPTGHTIRLLNLPAAWTAFIATNTTGTSCLGPLSGLESQKHLYAASLRALADGETTTLVLVTRPERSALQEAERTREELAGIGMRNGVLVVNGMFHAAGVDDAIAAALERRQRDALAAVPVGLQDLPRVDVRLSAVTPMGIAGLRALFAPARESAPVPTQRMNLKARPSLTEVIDDLAAAGAGVVLTMGKGGVGKTTVAAAIAVALADRGHTVHLSTTDPAAHVAATVNSVLPGLSISRIDPAAETAHYTREVLSRAASDLDEQGMALLEEDLRSPCTEEIAVFRAFAEAVASRTSDFIVLDTAPTGHTLLLLDAAEAYHREVTRKISDVPDSVREFLPRLRDAQFTRVIIVTLPEATPVHEAARLQSDLARAEIGTYAWVVNQSFAAAGSHDPVLRHKAELEQRFIEEVESTLATRMTVLPWVADEPVGPVRLRNFAGMSRTKELVTQ